MTPDDDDDVSQTGRTDVLPRATARTRLQDAGCAALAVAVSVLVYVPILRNYFHGDDFQCLNMLVNMPFAEWVIQPFAGHFFVVRNVFFSVMYALVGVDVRIYFLVVLALHAVNVLIVFAIARAVTQRATIACLAAAAWGVAPTNEGVLGWLAASGHVFMGTTTLVAVGGLFRRLLADAPITLRDALGWDLLLFAGAVSFGAGLGVALAFPLVVLMLVGPRRLARGVLAPLVLLPVCVVAMCLAGQQARFVGALPGIGLPFIVSLLRDLFGLGVTGLVGGLWYPLESYPTVGAYLFMTGVVTCWCAGFLLGGPVVRRVLTALAMLIVADYGAVVIGRAPVFATSHFNVQSVDLYRYHYSSASLLAIGSAVAVGVILCRLAVTDVVPAVVLAGWMVATGIQYRTGTWTINHFDDERAAAERAVSTIRQTLAHAPDGEPTVLTNDPFKYAGGFPFFAGYASFYVIYVGRAPAPEVYFVDRSAVGWYGRLPGSPLSAVLVPPPQGGLAQIACLARMPLQCVAND
jgi:hypothetical protein